MPTEASFRTPYWTTPGGYPVSRSLFQRRVLHVVLGGVRVGQLIHDIEALAVRVVDLHERMPLIGKRVFWEDRLDRGLRLAGAAIDALLRTDHEDAVRLMDAVDGTDVDTGQIFDVDAGLGDDVRHRPLTLALAEAGVRPMRLTPEVRLLRDQLLDDLRGALLQ